MSENDEKGIPIPEELLTELRAKKSQAFSGEDSEDGPTDAGYLSPIKFEFYTKLGEWLAGIADKNMKKAGGPGFDLISAKEFAKMGVIAYEKELSEMSPERASKLLFSGASAAILTENAFAIVREKRKEKKDEKEDQEEDA